jgi:hypothetical protein
MEAASIEVLQQVEAAVLAMHREPARAAEADHFLQQFQRAPLAWNGASRLLGSVHAEASLFGACCLHQKARLEAAALSPPDALALTARCLEALGGAGAPGPMRTQLALAAGLLSSRGLESPEGLSALPSFSSLLPPLQVELLSALPLTWHHERLRSSLPAVLQLLASLAPPNLPAPPPVTACVAAWQPLGAGLSDLGPLVPALALALAPRPNASGQLSTDADAAAATAAADALCGALEVGGFPPSSDATRLTQALLATLAELTSSVLPPAATAETALPLCRVLSAAVASAPAEALALSPGAAESNGGGAGGGAGCAGVLGALLALCRADGSDMPTACRLLEESGAAWGAVGGLGSEDARVREAWGSLASILLARDAMPDDGADGALAGGGGSPGGRAGGASGSSVAGVDWDSCEMEEEEFWRFRRTCVQELWHAVLNGAGAAPVAALIQREVTEAAAEMGRGGGWRRCEAALHAIECTAPALLPAIRPVSSRTSGMSRRSLASRLSASSDDTRNGAPAAVEAARRASVGAAFHPPSHNGGSAAEAAVRAAAAAGIAAEGEAQRALAPSVGGALAVACGVRHEDAHGCVLRAALQAVGAFAAWLAPADRCDACPKAHMHADARAGGPGHPHAPLFFPPSTLFECSRERSSSY